jgi:hypothetical protein
MFLDPDEVMKAADGHCVFKETTCWPLYILLQQPYSLSTEDEQLGFTNVLLLTPAPNHKGFGGIMPLLLTFIIFLTISISSARRLVSSSLLGSAREASTRYRAENRTWACLTANRRTTN